MAQVHRRRAPGPRLPGTGAIAVAQPATLARWQEAQTAHLCVCRCQDALVKLVLQPRQRDVVWLCACAGTGAAVGHSGCCGSGAGVQQAHGRPPQRALSGTSVRRLAGHQSRQRGAAGRRTEAVGVLHFSGHLVQGPVGLRGWCACAGDQPECMRSVRARFCCPQHAQHAGLSCTGGHSLLQGGDAVAACRVRCHSPGPL